MGHIDYIAAIRKFGIAGGDVLDVGANVGGWLSSWLALGAGRIVAVEPVPDAFATLEAAYRDDPRVTTLRLGVSDRDGEHAPAMNVHNCWTLLSQGNHALEPALEYKGKPPFAVDFLTIDTICSREQLSPRFIKIDTDGYDAKAMRGAREVIRAHRPLIKLEVSYLPHFVGDCCECMIRDAFAYGYRVQSFLTQEIFASSRDFMRKYPWDTSFDVFLLPHGFSP